MDLSCIAGKEGERKTSSDNGYIQHVIQMKVYKIMSVSASRTRGRYNRLGTEGYYICDGEWPLWMPPRPKAADVVPSKYVHKAHWVSGA